VKYSLHNECHLERAETAGCDQALWLQYRGRSLSPCGVVRWLTTPGTAVHVVLQMAASSTFSRCLLFFFSSFTRVYLSAWYCCPHGGRLLRLSECVHLLSSPVAIVQFYTKSDKSIQVWRRWSRRVFNLTIKIVGAVVEVN